MTTRWGSHVFGGAALISLASLLVPACSIGAGTGSATGQLDVPDCWVGQFDLQPDFFAGEPYMDTSYVIRIQRGSDSEEFSDGIAFLVDDVNPIRNGELGQALKVSLSPAVTPPGVPIVAEPNPAVVHATLYMNQTCRIQNIALYALDAVTLDANGGCLGATPDGGAPPSACNDTGLVDAGMSSVADAGASDAGADATVDGGDAGVAGAGLVDGGLGAPYGIAESSITFTQLADANPDESNASQRYTAATFDLYLADPREICAGGLGPPPPCRGHVQGSLNFYFERGRPAQAFP